MPKNDTCVVFGIPWAAGRFCRRLATLPGDTKWCHLVCSLRRGLLLELQLIHRAFLGRDDVAGHRRFPRGLPGGAAAERRSSWAGAPLALGVDHGAVAGRSTTDTKRLPFEGVAEEIGEGEKGGYLCGDPPAPPITGRRVG